MQYSPHYDAQTAPQPGEELVGDGPGGLCGLLGGEERAAVGADEGDDIPRDGVGEAGNVQEELVHAHAHHRTAASPEESL